MPSRSGTAAVHDWVRASPYRTAAAASLFLALFVASTPAPLTLVPSVFLGSLLVTVPAAFGVKYLRDRVGDGTDGTDGDRPRPGVRAETVDGAAADDALARLRERYAAGDLADDEFERRVERLIETAELGDVLRDGRRRGRSSPSTGGPDAEVEVEAGAGTEPAAGDGSGAGTEGDRTAADPERS